MGKFYNAVGYSTQKEIKPGVWEPVITERFYKGDTLRDMNRVRQGENLNDNVVVDNRLSIVADPYAYENFHSIVYVMWMGAKWKVLSVEVQRPRLIFTIGGVYNEQTPRIS